MTVLDQIIEDAAGEAVSTSSVLRKVMVVARRVQATHVSDWVRHELDGFDEDDALPKYRSDLFTPVLGVWSGPMGSSMEQTIGPGAIPKDANQVLFHINLRQSIDELEQLAAAKNDREPSVSWTPHQVVRFNQFIDQGLVPHPQYMALLSAERVVTRGMIRGVLGSVRTVALNLALELQEANPQAGTANGPTIAEPSIGASVFNVTNNIYGTGVNLAVGHDNTISSVIEGDVRSLLRAATDCGLTDQQALTDLQTAAETPHPNRPLALAQVVRAIRANSYAISTGVATSILADQIEAAINLFLGLTP